MSAVESVTVPETQVEGSPLDQKTQDNYRVWKKNTPYLYDYISTYSLLWPSLTVQFFPDLEKPEDNIDPSTTDNGEKKLANNVFFQRLLVGTFTGGQSIDNISILQLPYYTDLNKLLNIDKLNYNPDKQEFEISTVPKKKISVLQKVNHFGDVNTLKYMPQNPDVIASGNSTGNLLIYDRTKHSSYKNNIIGENTDIAQPQLQLGEKTTDITSDDNQDIFALDWNKQKEGVITSGSMNGKVNLFDIKSQFVSKDDYTLPALTSFDIGVGINEIEWVPGHDSIFSTADELGSFKMYDTRSNSIVLDKKISQSPINTVSVNPKNLVYIANGDNDGSINIWDIRNIQHDKPSTFNIPQAHDDSIGKVKWHPRYHNVLGSCSSDRTVKMFDVSKINNNEELIFVHGGHMLGVNDFDWSLHEDWMVSSVADDNSLHIWKPDYHIVKGYC